MHWDHLRYISLYTNNTLTGLLRQLPNPLFSDSEQPEVAMKQFKLEAFRHILRPHPVQLFPDTPTTPTSRDWVSPKIPALRGPLANKDVFTFPHGMILVSQYHLAAFLSLSSSSLAS